MIELSRRGVLQSILTALVALLTVVALLLPMGEFPLWNGENPGHRNQYELMAEAILDGRITFDYGDEDSLASLENPYDPEKVFVSDFGSIKVDDYTKLGEYVKELL